jgi:hypothetical protein
MNTEEKPKPAVTLSEDGTSLSYPVWVKIGTMLYNRDCLDHDHPEQTYNFIKFHGFVPEDFGVYHPLYEEFTKMSRSDLIREVVDLRKQLDAMMRSGFF